ncbi:hypothetical protein GCM10007870_31370 [Gluconobacter kondonii]|uniref:Uncharacterized protein n=1 Tax=Gluconobacter kondonii TaxID=941463 RepID=A0ABQ5WY53_9PROT|nr:hypothetical protein AA3266_2769 [Gluconobacter kondonii NBRC 3266]GLQ67552.1 hypothetical protein GCM10007870_31370 [Gluconobacter kondonii]
MIHENEIQAGDYVYVYNSYNTFGLDFYGTEGGGFEKPLVLRAAL